MRGLSFLLLLVTAVSLLGESYSYAAMKRISIPELEFTSSNGERLRVRAQEFSTRCDDGYCFFKAGDHRIKVSEDDIEVLREERTYNPTHFTPRTYTGDDGELSGSSDYVDDYVSQSYTSAGASEHLECYQRLRDSHTSTYCPDRSSLPSISGCSGENTKARTDSLGWCARYVRFILNDCGVLPENSIAGRAENGGPALERQGFEKLNITDPNQAPLGSVIVYTGDCPAYPASADPGHIEIKTGPSEYTSDYVSTTARSSQTACRRVSGIYFK